MFFPVIFGKLHLLRPTLRYRALHTWRGVKTPRSARQSENPSQKTRACAAAQEPLENHRRGGGAQLVGRRVSVNLRICALQ